MIGTTALESIVEAVSIASRVGMADLASWQEAGISFGFVFAILAVGFALDRWWVGRHE